MSRVTILGREYRIKGVGDPAHLEDVAHHVDVVLKEILDAAPDTPDAPMLAALNIASELLLLQQQVERGCAGPDPRDRADSGLESRVQAMIDLIDSV